jgi:hypothetical protein
LSEECAALPGGQQCCGLGILKETVLLKFPLKFDEVLAHVR